MNNGQFLTLFLCPYVQYERRRHTKKEKKMPETSSTPTSLVHYTSMNAVTEMLNKSIADLKADPSAQPMLTFHASIGYAMNDRVEGKLFFDYFFTESEISHEIQGTLAKVKADKGEIFVISLSHNHDRQSNGSIPMWNMYGDHAQGLLLKFDYQKLKDSCSANGLTLQQVEYVHKAESNTRASECRKRMKLNLDDDTAMNEILHNAFCLKSEEWSFEEEYRIIKQEKPSKTKTGRYGIVSYAEVKIPITCLSSITIGPLAHQDIVEQSLKNVIDQITTMFPSFSCKIIKSTIQIR